MVELQLFIDGQQVELHDDESVSLTQTLQDVLDVQKVFTDYTRTFNIPASKTNNKIFKHYYNPAVRGTSVYLKKDAELYLNYKPFKTGKIRLESVEVSNHSPVNYRVTFFGNTVVMKDLIGDQTLSDISLLNTSLTYDATKVKEQMQDGIDISVDGEDVADAVIYPLISKERRLYYDSSDSADGTGNLHYDGQNSHGVVFDDLKPAVRVHAILLAIKKQYGLKFSDDFFNSNNPDYYNLYLWLHKQKGGFKSVLTDADRNNWQRPTGTWQNVLGDRGLAAGFYQSSGYGYKNYNNYRGKRYIAVNVETDPSIEYTLAVYGHGEKLFEQEFTGSQDAVSIYDALEMKKGYFGNIDNPNNYIFNIKSESNATFTLNVTVLDARDDDATKAYAKTTITTTVDYRTSVVQEMPNIKVLDFLTSLFKMFNLTAYYKDGVIQVLPLDDWYAASTNTYDITEYLDHTKSEVSLKFPYSNIEFGYQGNDSFFSSFHSQYNDLEWGGLSYLNEADTLAGSYKIDIPFEHHKFERLKNVADGNYTTVQWGWSVNKDQEPYLGKPLLFYAHKVTSGTSISVLDSAGGSQNEITNYYIPSNSSNPTTDTQTIHFGAEMSEYTRNNSSKSLFQTYYRSYIEEVFDESRRIFKYKAYLPLRILMNLNLNDRVIIFNELYKINKITTNFENNLTNLELVNEVQDFEIEINQIIAQDTDTVDSGLATADTTLVTADTTVFRW